MIIHEELFWILDAKEGHFGSWDEEKVRRNIEFVHSLGRKCDVVGWSKLDLADPKADRILLLVYIICSPATLLLHSGGAFSQNSGFPSFIWSRDGAFSALSCSL